MHLIPWINQLGNVLYRGERVKRIFKIPYFLINSHKFSLPEQKQKKFQCLFNQDCWRLHRNTILWKTTFLLKVFEVSFLLFLTCIACKNENKTLLLTVLNYLLSLFYLTGWQVFYLSNSKFLVPYLSQEFITNVGR